MPSNSFLRLIVYASVMLIVAIITFTVVQSQTERNAKSFCKSINIGSSTDGLFKAAIDRGGSVPKQGWSTRTDTTKMVMVKFTGLNPIYGYFCIIHTSNGVVISKELSVLDP
jgi:hypothetical protein